MLLCMEIAAFFTRCSNLDYDALLCNIRLLNILFKTRFLARQAKCVPRIRPEILV